MTRIFFLPLLVFIGCASFQAAGGEQISPTITLYAHFDHPCSAASVRAMKSELDSIMAPIGLDFEWRALDASHGDEVAVELVVVNFRGACRIEDMLPGPNEPVVLGWTHMSDGKLLPFCDVDCDRVRKFINPAITGRQEAERARLLGRALGRVLAHELYHIFGQTTQHARAGLAKALYTPGELAADRFQFKEKETQALRRGRLRSLRLPRPTHSTALAGQR